jgi:hypothetical protein
VSAKRSATRGIDEASKRRGGSRRKCGRTSSWLLLWNEWSSVDRVGAEFL